MTKSRLTRDDMVEISKIGKIESEGSGKLRIQISNYKKIIKERKIKVYIY